MGRAFCYVVTTDVDSREYGNLRSWPPWDVDTLQSNLENKYKKERIRFSQSPGFGISCAVSTYETEKHIQSPVQTSSKHIISTSSYSSKAKHVLT